MGDFKFSFTLLVALWSMGLGQRMLGVERRAQRGLSDMTSSGCMASLQLSLILALLLNCNVHRGTSLTPLSPLFSPRLQQEGREVRPFHVE